MLKVVSKSAIDTRGNITSADIYDTVTLPYASRQKGRFRAVSDNGHDVGVFLPRDGVLRHGELLHTECGKTLQVHAKTEAVTEASCDDWQIFARACYHLGNRHVPLQIGERWLRFQPDHVLREMIEQLGLHTRDAEQSFTPEDGAYGGQRSLAMRAHAHNHSHGHSHAPDHSHEPDNSHAHDHAHNHDH